MFFSAARHGLILACLTCCEGNHCTSHEHRATPAHPRAFPLCPQAGSSGIFLRAAGCFSCHFYTAPSPCANTRSIFAKTTKQSHLLSFLFLLHPIPVSQRGLDALGPLSSVFGSSCLAVVGRARPGSPSRGQSRLLLVSHLFALCHRALPSCNLPSPEQPPRVCVYDLCLSRVSSSPELALALAAAFPAGAKAGRSLLHAKAPRSSPAGSRGSRAGSGRAVCLAVCLSILRFVLLHSLLPMHPALMFPPTPGTGKERGEVQVGWSSEQLGLVKFVPAHGKGLEQSGFYDPLLEFWKLRYWGFGI